MTTSPQWPFKSNKYDFYLSSFSNSKHEIFALSWPGFTKPSQHFPKISGDFLRFLNITKTVLATRCTDKHFRSFLKGDNFSYTKSTLSTFLGKLIEFSILIICYRTICPNLWVRHEKLSLMHEKSLCFRHDTYASCMRVDRSKNWCIHSTLLTLLC